jgi:hypothetical protein
LLFKFIFCIFFLHFYHYPGVPSRDSSSGLPYSRSVHYHLSYRVGWTPPDLRCNLPGLGCTLPDLRCTLPELPCTLPEPAAPCLNYAAPYMTFAAPYVSYAAPYLKICHCILPSPGILEDDLPRTAKSRKMTYRGLANSGLSQAPVRYLPASPNQGR